MGQGQVTDDVICKIIGSAIPRSVPKTGVTPPMSLRADLGIDSVGLMSIVFLLDEQAGVDAFSHVQAFISAEYVSDIITIVRQG